jgi:isopenicillin-N epimerase
MASSLKSLYLLDPDVTFLNHGSFGACPRPVFETYQDWQLRLERQPVEFIARKSPVLLAEARQRLAEYLGADAKDLVYVSNSTTAINIVARSLNLQPGDEILATDHEYPAMNQTWSYIAQKTGAHYIRRPIRLPFSTAEEFVEDYWAGVNTNTRVIFLSHIPFSLAVILPIKEICRRAREAGLISIVDGAHAPGQISLHMRDIGADIYFGACHKWLSAPKGSSFLFANPQAQEWVDPLIISRGWDPRQVPDGATRFIEFLEYQGTRDLSAFLSVPAAIDFQAQHDWNAQQSRCHALAASTRNRINAITGLDPICPEGPEWFKQLVSIRLPEIDLTELSRRLIERYRVEVPMIQWPGSPNFVRVSFQAYNEQRDADALVEALAVEIPQLLASH